MSISRRKVWGSIVLAVAILVIAVWLSFLERSGVVMSYRDLPKHGFMLPDCGESEIYYHYDPAWASVWTRTQASSSLYHQICTQLGLMTGGYNAETETSGFMRSDMDSEFVPKGSRVLCAWGSLYPEGRPLVHVYLEVPPQGETNSMYTLYLHVN